MDEASWLAGTDPWRMLDFLSGKTSERKLRLFACACCRQPAFFDLWTTANTAALTTAERYADGQGNLDQLRRAARAAFGLGPIWCCADKASVAADSWIRGVYRSRPLVPRSLLAGLLHCIFGNPFRPVSLGPACLTWNEGTVGRLAQAAYDHRSLPAGSLDRVRLAILADALEEAGCNDRHLLGHLREPGSHVRGCFGVDAALGKS
jgi:hypothetical protein